MKRIRNYATSCKFNGKELDEETGRQNVDGKYRRLYDKYVKNKML